MPNFKVTFPDRVVQPDMNPHRGCCMVACTGAECKRGVTETISAVDKRDAWDKMHRKYPFERIVVE